MKARPGFTLAEVLIVSSLMIVLLLGLCSLMLPALRTQAETGRRNRAQSEAFIAYKAVSQQLASASYVRVRTVGGLEVLEGCVNYSELAGAKLVDGSDMEAFVFCFQGSDPYTLYKYSVTGPSLPCPPALVPQCGSASHVAIASGLQKLGAEPFFSRPAGSPKVVDLALRSKAGPVGEEKLQDMRTSVSFEVSR